MTQVVVLSTGMTKFTDAYEYGIRDLGMQALMRALNNKSISKNELDGLYVGNMSSQAFTEQGLIGPLIAADLELDVPVTTVNLADASGASALRQAYLSIKSGQHDLVAVLGVEKVTDMLGLPLLQGIYAMNVLDRRYEGQQGLTLAAAYAMMAQEHKRKYGTTDEQRAMVAVKNHMNGKVNPYAQFRNLLKLDSVLSSKVIADPIRLFELSAAGDGGAAVLLASEKIAKQYTDEYIYIKGSGQASMNFRVAERNDLADLPSVRKAAQSAYAQAAIEPKNVHLAEVHDSVTISEIMTIEALGLVKPGEGGVATEEGWTKRDGQIPINTSGGLKARGAPFGAVGIAQVVEVYEQLLSIAGERQVSDAEIAVTENHAGTGVSSVVHVFSR